MFVKWKEKNLPGFIIKIEDHNKKAMVEMYLISAACLYGMKAHVYPTALFHMNCFQFYDDSAPDVKGHSWRNVVDSSFNKTWIYLTF